MPDSVNSIDRKIAQDALYPRISPSYFKDFEETEIFAAKKSPLAPSVYQQAQLCYTPEDKSTSWYGGSGLAYKLGNTSINGFFGGRTSSTDHDGYMAEVIIDQKWPGFMQPFEDLTLSSNLRIRHNHCGSENMQYRMSPVKASYNIDNELIPIDNVYVYPIYATAVTDLKDDNDCVKFGSLIGASKNIGGRNYYVEAQFDTNNERSSDINLCINIGFKF